MRPTQKPIGFFVTLLYICVTISQKCQGLAVNNISAFDDQSRQSASDSETFKLSQEFSPALFRPISSLLNKVINKNQMFQNTSTTEKMTCESVGGTTCYSKLARGLCVVKGAIGFIPHLEADAYCAKFGNGLGTVYQGTPFSSGTPWLEEIELTQSAIAKFDITIGALLSYFSCLGIDNDRTLSHLVLLGPVPSDGSLGGCRYLVIIRDVLIYLPSWERQCYDTVNFVGFTAVTNAPVCVVNFENEESPL